MNQLIAIQEITQRIYILRGVKVMLDRDLANLYGVETKRLKAQVRRNADRFPPDFMFELTNDEYANWRSQIATSNPPAVFASNPSAARVPLRFQPD